MRFDGKADREKYNQLLERQGRDARFELERLGIIQGKIPINPAMIRLARELRGLLPSGMARKLKITTAMMKAIEAGRDPLGAVRLIQAISDVLHLPVRFFAQTDKIDNVMFMCRCGDV